MNITKLNLEFSNKKNYVNMKSLIVLFLLSLIVNTQTEIRRSSQIRCLLSEIVVVCVKR